MDPASALDQSPICVNDREQLIYLLAEAAEIEHGLMCCYLYAAWSLKSGADDGLTEAQDKVLCEWRHRIHGVAMEEMVHLALVSNLLMSLGAPPHFSRPNFPVAPGYFPSSVVMRLTPFTRDVADHFVYLERPESSKLPRARGFEVDEPYRRHEQRIRLTPSAEDYGTVSHLYRGIADGLQHLSATLGEAALFCGDPAAQIGPSVLSLPSLIEVGGLQDALAAIETIVEQGEGGRADHEGSHYMSFSQIRDEYDEFLRTDPHFVPHRPVVSDPVMFAPIGGDALQQVRHSRAACVLDLANASYGLMLRLLASGFGQAHASDDARRAMINGAISVMGIVKVLSVQLTAMPAGEGNQTAGMNFHLPRATLALPQPNVSGAILAERSYEIAAALETACSQGIVSDPALAERMRTLAVQLVTG